MFVGVDQRQTVRTVVEVPTYNIKDISQSLDGYLKIISVLVTLGSIKSRL